MQGRNEHANIENELVDMVGEGESSMNGMLFMSLVLLVIAVVGFTYFKVQDYIEQKKEEKEGR